LDGAIAIGTNAMSSTGGNGATGQIAIGKGALQNLASPTGNTAIGYNAANDLTNGASNTVLGYGALSEHTTGNRNVAIGGSALGSAQAGASQATAATSSDCVAVGYGAMGGNWADAASIRSVAVGNYAMGNAMNTANDDAAFGYNALNDITQANDCSAFGSGAGSAITTGSENTMIGYNAGQQCTTAGRNVIVGASSNTATDNGYENVFGWDVDSAGADKTTIGSGSSESELADGGETWSAVSDVRTKKNIVSSEIGLDFIDDLRAVTFNYKTLGELPSDHRRYEENSTEIFKKRPKTQLGFISQEVKTAMDTHNVPDGSDLWYQDPKGYQWLGETSLIPMLVKAVQELSQQVEDLKKKVG